MLVSNLKEARVLRRHWAMIPHAVRKSGLVQAERMSFYCIPETNVTVYVNYTSISRLASKIE